MNLRIVGLYSFECLLAFVLTMFFRFHLLLVIRGSTTIENIERRGGASEFSLSVSHNWQVVFGSNPWLWLLPTYGTSGQPLGDGVTWQHTGEKASVSDTPKVKDGEKKINLSVQEDALFQLRGASRTTDRVETNHHDESELRDLNRASVNNSSVLSHSFKA